MLGVLIIQTLAPWLVWRRCQTCKGECYVPAHQETKLFTLCPECRVGDPDCPACLGTGIVRVRHEQVPYYECPDCYNGRWPRAWAWRLCLVADLNGEWRSNTLNLIYSNAQSAEGA